MALIKCTECGHDVSDKAKMCPNCGCLINKGISTITKKVLWCILAFVLYLILEYIFEYLFLVNSNYSKVLEVIQVRFLLYLSLSYVLSIWAAKNSKRIVLLSSLVFFSICVLACWIDEARIHEWTSTLNVVRWFLFCFSIICCFILIWESGTLFYTKYLGLNFAKSIITIVCFMLLSIICSHIQDRLLESDGTHDRSYVLYSDELENRAANRDAIAQYELYMYYKGGHKYKDMPSKALQWLIESANNGLTRAMRELGYYYYGYDRSEALSWWKNAAEQGDETAEEYVQRMIKGQSPW